MRHSSLWLSPLLGGLFLLTSCTVQQQRDVLGTIGTVIPGSSTSRVPSLYSSSSSSPSTPAATPPTPTPPPRPVAVAPPPPPPSLSAPPVDLGKTDAELVLHTLQRAMSADPSVFQECLDAAPCHKALSTHLKQLQQQAGETLTLPVEYDQYDLEHAED